MMMMAVVTAKLIRKTQRTVRAVLLDEVLKYSWSICCVTSAAAVSCVPPHCRFPRACCAALIYPSLNNHFFLFRRQNTPESDMRGRVAGNAAFSVCTSTLNKLQPGTPDGTDS